MLGPTRHAFFEMRMNCIRPTCCIVAWVQLHMRSEQIIASAHAAKECFAYLRVDASRVTHGENAHAEVENLPGVSGNASLIASRTLFP